MGAFLGGLALGALLGAAGGWLLLRSRLSRLARFLSFAAHEINTPITAVNMTILNLLSGVFGPVPADQQQWVEMMREQVGRLNGMVGELRDLIHMELHRDIHLHFEDVPARDILEHGQRAIAFGCGSAGVPFEVEAPATLPLVRCDPDRAPRTLASLLFHARKFRSEGPIKLSAREAGSGVVFSVRYQGPALPPGIAEKSLDLWFPALARGDQRMSATGLGLGILRRIARRQSGDVRLTESGQGAVLELELPRARNTPETSKD